MLIDPIEMLKERQGTKSLRGFAEEIGISPMYLSDIYKGRREPGWKALAHIGLEKVVERLVTYRSIAADHTDRPRRSPRRPTLGTGRSGRKR
jgi:transcriptional regulator with XRE-family HTH domain